MKTTWPSALRLVLSMLAFVHSFPARKHLALFFAAPSVDEAWKGFGALLAVGLYCAPTSWYARGIAMLVRRRRLFLAVSMVMVVVHLVPALDHLPQLLRSPSWGDLWRGGGAAVAVAWFALPVRRQVALVQFLRGSARRGSNERRVKASSIVLSAMLVLAASGIYACGQSKSAAPNTAEAGAPCLACVSDTSCNGGEICGQFGGDSYCAPL